MRGQRAPSEPMAGTSDLQNIEDALDRLESGNFGYCEACGAPIALKRLCNNPTVSLCSDCEES